MKSSSVGTAQVFKLVLIHTKSSSKDGHEVVRAEAVP